MVWASEEYQETGITPPDESHIYRHVKADVSKGFSLSGSHQTSILKDPAEHLKKEWFWKF